MEEYYEKVGAYYDEDAALGFEQRAEANPCLKRIRSAFRGYVQPLNFTNALELGCGPGFDAHWLAETWPDRKVLAMDVSAKMVEITQKRLSGFPNAVARQGTEQDIAHQPEAPFNLVVVFFGALNTVDDLKHAADKINAVLLPGGHAVLTFVNKWYMRELIVNLLKFRFRTAFARLRLVWGGYSTTRFLESRCYTPAFIRRCFGAFEEVDRQGFSIVYPAWYNCHKVKGKPDKEAKLWALDRRLNNGPLWKYGEYLLFVFHKPEA